ncbi:MAG: V-type ATP synthase subunit D [Candidatus Thermoplasmatota archaeon]|jgi:V/A-type H+-transporting ATPase subunit D|nr:V-type ATP synthase subunit D [Candidatus Thermoplasmatota archaeon]
MVKQEVKPTRTELIAIKRKIALYDRGYKLLKMKRDGLVLEFFNILSKARDIRSQIIADYKKAEEKLIIATGVDGETSVHSVAFARREDPQVTMGCKNVMGTLVPTTVESATVKRRIDQRGYGIIGMSVRIDEAADAYEQLVEDIIVAAELETTLRRLIEEIEKNKRIVNALEFRILPELRKNEGFIRTRLEEMERENIFRLKRMKTTIA